MFRSLSSGALCLALALAPVAIHADAPAAADNARRPISFVVFGDSGYIPAYERLDDDERPMRTPGEYLAVEVEEWLERNATLEGFVPTPMTFESALGGFYPASGLYPVAWAMDEYCRRERCDFAAMVGDNVYPDGATLGADGISDERRFEDMLDRPFGKLGADVEQFKIYSMMGNHDWHVSREATFAQMTYLQQHPNFHIPDLYYKISPPGFEGRLEIFVVDTEMLLAGATVYKDQLDGHGREIRDGSLEEWDEHIRARTPGERNMVAWLERSLRDSRARWRIVMGHHALWSGGGSKYEKARALRALLMPALCKYADAYFSGDDHVLEVYTDSCAAVDGARPQPLPLLVTGAASKFRPLHPRFMQQQLQNNPQLRNLWSKGQTWGFMYARIQDGELAVRVLTTPHDFSGRPVLEGEFRFPRRSK